MAVGRRAMEYRSEQAWGDLPVVHVSVGGRQADGRYRLGRARGVIALGDVAIGLVGAGPRLPVGSVTRRESLVEGSRPGGVRDTEP